MPVTACASWPCRHARSRLAVGIPSSLEPRPKPRTTVPAMRQTGSSGIAPATASVKGGRPCASGLKSSSDGSTWQHPEVASGSGVGYSDLGSDGTATTRMPAAAAAWTPVGASSTTRQSPGATPSARAAARNTSGAGLPLSTSSPHTTAWKASCSSAPAGPEILAAKEARGVLVATAMGTPAARRCASSRPAPGSMRTSPHLAVRRGSLSSYSC
mmetsp:Transcript_12712/g.38325  ORF Transcript_12712/g.38325 Transcript_12712/m.38325 type:complete len:214 (-) Transcript_12712:258-899(-)